jgi:hypothetical protein
VKYEVFLFVKNLCEIGQLLGVENARVEVHVNSAIFVTLRASALQCPDNFLQLRNVFVDKDRADDFGLEVRGNAYQGRIPDYFPFAASQVGDAVTIINSTIVRDASADYALYGFCRETSFEAN